MIVFWLLRCLGAKWGFVQAAGIRTSEVFQRCIFLKRFLMPDSRNSSCPGRSPAEINVSIDPCGCAISGMDLLAKLIRFAFVDQVHGAAAESPTRHARSIT